LNEAYFLVVGSTVALLNEYNAVLPTGYLENDGTDIFWGTIAGNGGDWFELVVTDDHVDMRGWELVISDDTGGAGETTQSLYLTSDDLWADVRSGTIITVSEELADDASYDPYDDDWWINVQAADVGTGTYISNTDFTVSNVYWQLTIKDSFGEVIFGPAGEGVAPVTGIGNDEVFKLEEDPSAFIHPQSNYNDGTSSTFGAPNLYAAGTVEQDFSALRSVVTNCVDNADCDDAVFCNGEEVCDTGTCVAGTEPCQDPCERCDETTDTCEWCAYDLDYNGFIASGDFGAFAGCYGQCYPPEDPCLVANFDGSPDGCVGSGDFGGFAGCYGLACSECGTCFPDLRSNKGAEGAIRLEE
jgi:hypothetical protein